MTRKLRVLALATYPNEAASSRYRLGQYLVPLAERGVDVTFSPFLDVESFDALYAPWKFLRRTPWIVWRLLRRFADVARAARADVIFVQREALLFGPPFFEWLIARVLRRPMVLDLDDPTYIAYVSPVYGRLATALKWPAKPDTLIRWSTCVIAGNEIVAGRVRSGGRKAVLIPTVVDLNVFTPDLRARVEKRKPVIGWLGSHGTFQYLEPILPVLSKLGREHDFVLRIVGSGRESLSVPGVDVDLKPWSLADEVSDFQSFDIGLYPITEDRWSVGKSGLKAIQYMALAVPFVMSPVGVCASLGAGGQTHFLARTNDEWHEHLHALLRDRDLRTRMGDAGRQYAVEHYSLDPQADSLANALRDAASRM